MSRLNRANAYSLREASNVARFWSAEGFSAIAAEQMKLSGLIQQISVDQKFSRKGVRSD